MRHMILYMTINPADDQILSNQPKRQRCTESEVGFIRGTLRPDTNYKSMLGWSTRDKRAFRTETLAGSISYSIETTLDTRETQAAKIPTRYPKT
ncbi:unnamed protein product [Dovyalis caffra]|uniref:Uncharacterized protein n=1 Tax=Dovyalis caffra TaxID=77055 RepID=A0AAV1SQV0_9ROSI|nr:unnamed protein product [Dovyalis caffra]